VLLLPSPLAAAAAAIRRDVGRVYIQLKGIKKVTQKKKKRRHI
jgi:hypothetical protein